MVKMSCRTCERPLAWNGPNRKYLKCFICNEDELYGQKILFPSGYEL